MLNDLYACLCVYVCESINGIGSVQYWIMKWVMESINGKICRTAYCDRSEGISELQG